MGDNLGNRKTMSKNIQYYMNLRGATRKEICDTLKIPYTTFTDWVNGNAYPRIDKIEMMANYFGIEKSDLVEEPIIIDGKRLRSPTRIVLPGGDDVLDISKLTDEQKDMVKKMVEMLKNSKD